MYKTRFRKVGVSLMMTVPPAQIMELIIKPGDSTSYSAKDGQIFAKPLKCTRKSIYRLADLLANTDYPLADSDREWIDAPAIGLEIAGNNI